MIRVRLNLHVRPIFVAGITPSCLACAYHQIRGHFPYRPHLIALCAYLCRSFHFALMLHFVHLGRHLACLRPRLCLPVHCPRPEIPLHQPQDED